MIPTHLKIYGKVFEVIDYHPESPDDYEWYELKCNREGHEHLTNHRVHIISNENEYFELVAVKIRLR